MSDDISQNKIRLRIPSARATVEYASKFIRKTIPQADYWITNRHRWMHNIPTEGCDVVVTFSIGIENTTLMWLLSRLKSTGLNLGIRHNVMTNCYQCYLTAPLHILLKCAEEHHLPKRLNSEFGGGLKEFVKSEENKFDGFKNEIEFFTMQERQWLIQRLLESLRFRAGDEIDDVKCIEGQVMIPKCLSSGIITQIYPVHDMQALKFLRKTWVRSVFNQQPIDDITDYFGVKIAMYFAWLGHYTYAMTIPAIVGLVFWLVSFCRISQSVADTGFVLFSFFNVIWFSIYLEAWKRYCAELAYKWGTLDQRDELLVEPRPLFTGPLERSSVTGRLEPQYPSWKRNIFRYFVSVPVIGICISIVVGIMTVSFKLQDWWDKKIISANYFQCVTFVPKILLGIVISFLDEIYYKVALWLNNKENYRLDREYENNLIVKVATFQFVNSFISLFYIAFYLQDQERLKVQLAVLLITRQIIQNIKESALPYLIEQFRLAKLSFDLFGALSPSVGKEKREFSDHLKSKERKKHRESSTIPQAEVESTLFKYEGTFSEHLEMFIQLGYVVLFSSAFPMAAFCAFVNNLIEIRSDAFKMCFIYQRPFGQRVSNIGMWLNTMEVMGLIAILVNCALIGLSGQVHRMFPDMSKTQTILLIVALEHVMLIIRFLISCLIPDKPTWVATEMAKEEFARREAVNRFPSTTTTPPSDPAKTISTVTDTTNELSSAIGSDRGDRSSEESDCFEAAMDAACSRITNDSIDSDFSQSVDNIDRILRNIDEEKQSPVAQQLSAEVRHRGSRGSASSDDFTSTSSLSEPIEARYQVVSSTVVTAAKKNTDRSTPLSSAQVMKDWAVSTTEHLDRGANAFAPLRSYSTAGDRCSAKHVDISPAGDCSPCRSTGCISSSTTPDGSDCAIVQSATQSDEKLDWVGSETSSTTTEEAAGANANVMKKRLRSTFIKRARSVAAFSLKLKERRAKSERSKEVLERGPSERSDSPTRNEDRVQVGGELSCVPIEMLISVDDINLKKVTPTTTPRTALKKKLFVPKSRFGTPTSSVARP